MKTRLIDIDATTLSPSQGSVQANVRDVVVLLCATLTSIVFSTGCSPVFSSTSEASLIDSGEYHINTGLVVPDVKGAEGCGAQALAAVLAFYDPSLDVNTLSSELPWQEIGATPVDLLLEARAHGFVAEISRGDWQMLTDLAKEDRAPLVMLDVAPVVRTLFSSIPTGKAMHWAVVSGCSIGGNERILLGAPGDRHHVVQQDDFLARWETSDFCLIVLRSGDD